MDLSVTIVCTAFINLGQKPKVISSVFKPGNILPLYLPIFIFKSHLYTIILWNIFIISSTVLNAHSSYKDNNHVNHHINFNVNYGTGLYMDTLLNTKK